MCVLHSTVIHVDNVLKVLYFWQRHEVPLQWDIPATARCERQGSQVLSGRHTLRAARPQPPGHILCPTHVPHRLPIYWLPEVPNCIKIVNEYSVWRSTNLVIVSWQSEKPSSEIYSCCVTSVCEMLFTNRPWSLILQKLQVCCLTNIQKDPPHCRLWPDAATETGMLERLSLRRLL